MYIRNGFDQNAYKQLKKSGYAFSTLASLGCVNKEKPYGLNDTQKIVESQEGGVATPRISLG